jgi:hypothetical protein
MLHVLEEKLSRALVQDVTRTVEKSPHQNRFVVLTYTIEKVPESTAESVAYVTCAVGM